MRRTLLIMIMISPSSLALSGCREEVGSKAPRLEQQAAQDSVESQVNESLQATASSQAQSLKNAVVTVHRAYDYRGYTWLEPAEGAKLIAVDVEFSRYDGSLDLDDVEIIDGSSGANYGSDPHIALLQGDGELSPNPDDASWPADMGQLRVLLIYAVPKEMTSIKLSYWGQDLTPEASMLSKDGPSLPLPSN
jgi:hypothetical protein